MPVDLNDLVDKSPVQNKLLFVINVTYPHKFNPRFMELQRQRMNQFLNEPAYQMPPQQLHPPQGYPPQQQYPPQQPHGQFPQAHQHYP
jgi:hypothetical protein